MHRGIHYIKNACVYVPLFCLYSKIMTQIVCYSAPQVPQDKHPLGLSSAPAGQELPSITGQQALVDRQPLSVTLQLLSVGRNPATKDLRLHSAEGEKKERNISFFVAQRSPKSAQPLLTLRGSSKETAAIYNCIA